MAIILCRTQCVRDSIAFTDGLTPVGDWAFVDTYNDG